MSIHVPMNFFKETITRAVTLTGATNIYVSAHPSPSEGYVTISPASATLREIIYYTAKGTDGNGTYLTVTLANRGLGGTTAQTHAIGEPVRMNVSAETIQEISDALDQIVAAGAQDATVSIKGISRGASTTELGIVEEATAAEITAGTATGSTGARLFINPTAVAETGTDKIVKTKSTGKLDSSIIPSPIVAHGNATKNISGTTATTIAHGLSSAPSIVRIKGVLAASGGICDTYATYMNGTQSHVVLWGDTGSGATEYTQASFALLYDSTPHGLSGAISVDATNITITWTDFPGSSLPSVTAQLMWEAQI